jgi:hypothetical protein
MINWVISQITDLCLLTIFTLNRYKDRNLSQDLWQLAELYNPSPGMDNYYKGGNDNAGCSI